MNSVETRIHPQEAPKKVDGPLKALGVTLLAISGLCAAGSIYELEQSFANQPARSEYETDQQYQITLSNYEKQEYDVAFAMLAGFSVFIGAYGYGFVRIAEGKDIIPTALGNRMDSFLENSPKK